jgi:hypothetical protein
VGSRVEVASFTLLTTFATLCLVVLFGFVMTGAEWTSTQLTMSVEPFAFLSPFATSDVMSNVGRATAPAKKFNAD